MWIDFYLIMSTHSLIHILLSEFMVYLKKVDNTHTIVRTTILNSRDKSKVVLTINLVK